MGGKSSNSGRTVQVIWYPWWAWRPVKLQHGPWAWGRTVMWTHDIRRYYDTGVGIYIPIIYAEPFLVKIGTYGPKEK